MNALHRLSLLAALSPPLAASAGCAGHDATVPDDLGASEDAVRVESCPASISVNVSVQSTRGDFVEWPDATDRAHLKTAAHDLAARRSVRFQGTRTTRRAGRCTYVGADGPVSAAVFFTAGGKDVLRVSTTAGGWPVFVYTYPRSYDATSLKYASGSPARFVARVARAGAVPDDPDAPEWTELGKGRAAVGAGLDGLILRNGTYVTRDDGPEKLRVIVPAGAATATASEGVLTTCLVKKNAPRSTASRTVFDLTVDYDNIDDGWNGCTFTFSASGYRAYAVLGFNVDT
jgi:hypothetical protein